MIRGTPRDGALRTRVPRAAVRVEPPVEVPAFGDPEVRIAAARFAAATASLHARSCWEGFVAAVEGGASCDEARHELEAALAAQVYAWAVYRCACADEHTRPEPLTGH